MPIRQILDLAEEEVAISAGLLITDHDLFELLAGTQMEGWANRLRGDPSEELGIRPEYYEDIVRSLRAAVGELPDASPAIVHRIKATKKLVERGIDPASIMNALIEATPNGPIVIDELVMRGVSKRLDVPLDAVAEVALMIAETFNRSSKFMGSVSGTVESREWDGAILLSDLFETESIPRTDAAHLDQRFIDFLAAQPGRLHDIHWRNFERLVAEFFNKQRYEVQLGPGTKDGGIDMRVWPQGKTDGPPLMVIQCKRYAEGRYVTVESVKSLWADLVFEGAQRGLIATTSAVTPEGQRMISARKYPLDLAESNKIKEWTRTMWRHSWRGEVRSTGLAAYGPPPFYPIRPGDFDFLGRWEGERAAALHNTTTESTAADIASLKKAEEKRNRRRERRKRN